MLNKYKLYIILNLEFFEENFFYHIKLYYKTTKSFKLTLAKNSIQMKLMML